MDLTIESPKPGFVGSRGLKFGARGLVWSAAVLRRFFMRKGRTITTAAQQRRTPKSQPLQADEEFVEAVAEGLDVGLRGWVFDGVGER